MGLIMQGDSFEKSVGNAAVNKISANDDKQNGDGIEMKGEQYAGS